MKTTLALLVAGLICVATPMLASADGRHDHGQHYSKEWVNRNQHSHHAQYEHNNHHWRNHYNQKRSYQTKNHLRKELRKTRHELNQVKRQSTHNRQRTYYAKPAVVIGIPHLVFQFDW
ncbi:hypothetical protein [uncultured Desulfuromusa sp.]|uniref:hypothetical protein n=1 Tax=uncultured Desulfuromusa sp. TaxID=219183 RepID=UPI002AA8DB22|nr:hypothetical protein [uncultured Desulfuromusa sp.]